MSNAIWVLRAPDGRVVGASARDALGALDDVPSGADNAYWPLFDAINANPEADRYSHAGYVLARGEVGDA